MDNKQTLMTAGIVGVGSVALAYLGHSYLTKEKPVTEMDKAADAAIIEITSVCTSGLRLMTVMTTCTSLRKSSLNDGLNGLSINLDISVSFSEGLPSLLKNPPGIFPAA